MKKISTNKAPKAIGPYSQGYVSGNLLFTAGQIAINPETGNIDNNDIEWQANQAFKNVLEIVKEAGGDASKVIKTTVFLTDLNNFSIVNKIYETYFISNPARSCVEVKALPKNSLIEIEVIAEL